MLESDLVKHQCFQRVERNRMFRFWLHRHFENLLEIVERGFGLTIDVNYVSQFLKRPKNEERIDKEREKLPDRNALGVDEIKHQEQDRSPQEIDDAALNKAEAPKVPDFFEFQLEDLIRGGVETIDFLLGKAEALYQFNVSQRLRRSPRQGRRLTHNALLNGLDSAAEQRAQTAEEGNGQQIGRSNRPMYPCCVDGHKGKANERREHHVYEQRDKLLNIASNSLQLPERFAAALVLKQGIGKFQRVPDAIRINAGANLLGDHVDEIILKVLGNARHERHTDSRC